jgi:hypothetical protein
VHQKKSINWTTFQQTCLLSCSFSFEKTKWLPMEVDIVTRSEPIATATECGWYSRFNTFDTQTQVGTSAAAGTNLAKRTEQSNFTVRLLLLFQQLWKIQVSFNCLIVDGIFIVVMKYRITSVENDNGSSPSAASLDAFACIHDVDNDHNHYLDATSARSVDDGTKRQTDHSIIGPRSHRSPSFGRRWTR